MNTVRYATAYEPWTLMNRLHRDLDRLLTPATGAMNDAAETAVVDWVPAVDIHEDATQFTLHVDLPGVKAEDIDVTLEKGVLTLRGRRTLTARDEKAGFRRVERVAGEFFRRFSLPDTTDALAVKARFREGVLEVTIPKQAQVQPRKVTVEAA